MRTATRWIAAAFGAFAGFGGLEHGYFEFLQGNAPPAGLMIASMGPPCVPEQVWHLCEPAMTVVPSFRVTGVVSMVLGMVTLVWAVAFVQGKHGGLVLAGLCLGLLLFGGGIFPPVIGLVGGLMGTRVNTPMTGRASFVWLVLARLWPWVMVIFFVGLFSQFVIGYFFNDFVMANGAVFIPVAILALMVLSILAGYGHDAQKVQQVKP